MVVLGFGVAKLQSFIQSARKKIKNVVRWRVMLFVIGLCGGGDGIVNFVVEKKSVLLQFVNRTAWIKQNC